MRLLLLLLLRVPLLLLPRAVSSTPNRCTIVGGGPAGLTLALALDRLSLFTKIDVLEKRPSLATVDATKAYLYLLDGRSEEVLRLVNVWERLKDLSVSSREFTSITEIGTSGTTRRLRIPIDKAAEEKLWVPREALVKALVDEIGALGSSRIEVHYSSSYKSAVDQDSCVIFDASGYRSEITSNLLDRGRVALYERDSDSAGLYYKILSVNASFMLPDGGTSDCESSYVFRSKQSDLNLGLLPVRPSAISSEGKRTANVIMRKDSALWQITDAKRLRSYLSERFPQLAGAALDSLVCKEEMERFASATPGVFPKPRCIYPLYDHCSIRGAVTVICGDAAHAFPPDIGQGVNSALEDVLCIYRAAQASGSSGSGGNGVVDPLVWARAYDFSRRRSHRALIDIMAIAFPYQYNQNSARKALAYANFALRLALNKICPPVFSKPLFFLVQSSTMPYERALQLANRTTRNILAVVAAAVALVIARALLNARALPGLLLF